MSVKLDFERQPPSVLKRRSLTIAQEALAVAASVLMFPLGLKPRTRFTPRCRAQRTIVFVHGYLANNATFLPLATYLAAKGHSSQLDFTYASSDGIEQAAIKLKHFLSRHVRGGRIDLICHSLGGLVARTYLQELGGARRVDRCVTIATPHAGTYNAYWLWSRVARELRPDSPLLRRLESSRERAGRVNFLSIAGEADRIVLPPTSALFAQDAQHLVARGHQGLLFSHEVFRLVARHLRP